MDIVPSLEELKQMKYMNMVIKEVHGTFSYKEEESNLHWLESSTQYAC
mgnify:CR=1 FL=1